MKVPQQIVGNEYKLAMFSVFLRLLSRVHPVVPKNLEVSLALPAVGLCICMHMPPN